MTNRVIILLGQRVRSGTNFVGVTLAQHPQVVTIPPHESSGELNLFRERTIEDGIFKRVAGDSFGSHIKAAEAADFLPLYAEAWINFFRNKYKLKDEDVIFIKSPVIRNWDLWRRAFPDSQIALLSRDGRDNLISSVVGSNDRRRWHSSWLNLKKNLNFYTGRSFIAHARDWKATARIFAGVPEGPRLKKFKYEELVNSAEGVERLLQFYELKADAAIVEQCLAAPVVGSSWGVRSGKMAKPNWSADYDKSKYQFTRKWAKWNNWKKAVFKRLGGQALIELGYERNLNW